MFTRNPTASTPGTSSQRLDQQQHEVAVAARVAQDVGEAHRAADGNNELLVGDGREKRPHDGDDVAAGGPDEECGREQHQPYVPPLHHQPDRGGDHSCGNREDGDVGELAGIHASLVESRDSAGRGSCENLAVLAGCRCSSAHSGDRRRVFREWG
jgi:hypothetical protein